MKHLSNVIGLLLLALMFQNCSQKEDITPAKEKTQFTFNLGATSGGRISSSIPTGTSIRLSIRKSTGESVADLQPVEIITMGDALMSAPVELPTGDYVVADFLLVNSTGVVTHAVPKSGSIMAALVSNPLGRSFSVNSAGPSVVAMEVVEISNYAATDFGYSTFDLTVIHPIKISVFAPAPGGGWKHVSADAFIMDGADTLQHLAIGAKISLVSFNQNTDSTFTLLIIKDAYARYTQTFNYHDIVSSLNGQVLKIYLTPAFTFVNWVNLDGGYVADTFFADIDYPVDDAHITVDWGDGTSSELNDNYMRHTYTTHQHFVTLTGDIDKITGFYSLYGFSRVKKISLDYLPELVQLEMTQFTKPRTIDLTHNPKIAILDFSGTSDIRTVSLPTENKIVKVDVTGASNFTTATLSAFIGKIYGSVVAENRHGGHFLFQTYDDDTAMIKRPTPAASNQLRALRDVYGWTILPNP